MREELISEAGKSPKTIWRSSFRVFLVKGTWFLDSFLGSGTTAAVALKMRRRFIGVEIGKQARTHCVPRLTAVVDGEQSGVSKVSDWHGGGGFRFFTLGDTVFDEHGCINRDIKFVTLAGHLWYMETRTPLESKEKSPYLGVHNEVAYYLLFNGVLGDVHPNGGNVLTSKVLASLPHIESHRGKIVIYGESTRLGEARLSQENITFKQIPYDVGAL